MEKIPAACAMQWSIELEKGLRSKKPGERIQAIEQIGPKLQHLSMEPNITMAISEMYDLVPGEDRTFANTILLRLADAFRYGSNDVRRCILQAFLLELRHLTKKGKKYNGVLAKQRVPNYVELLKRVKIVFDTGDVKAKALALRLIGCWADLAQDSAQIRYMILSSLQSAHASEVKASLFTAGCFCRLSEDFACIFLGMLINIVCSEQASPDVMLAAARAFSRMQCSFTIMSRAYKAGKQLVLGSLRDEFKVEMLSSLSKLACKSTLLIVEQVDLLLSFLGHESSSPMKARALKCLYFLFGFGAHCFPVSRRLLATLSSMIDDSDLEVNFQCDALRALLKMVRCMPLDPLFMEVPDLSKLFLTMANAAQSSDKVKRDLALHLLVDILCSLKRARGGHWSDPPEKWPAECFQFQGSPQTIVLASNGLNPTVLSCQVISLIIDHITSLIKQITVESKGDWLLIESLMSCEEVRQKCKSTLSLALRLIKLYPSAALVALDKIKCLIQTLDHVSERLNVESIYDSGEVSQIEFGAEKRRPVLAPLKSHKKEQSSNLSELILCIYRFANACLDELNDAGLPKSIVDRIVKLVDECIQQSGSCNCDTYEIFCLHMHSFIAPYRRGMTYDRMQDLDRLKVASKLGIFDILCWFGQEGWALEFSKKMVERKNYWAAYRSGKYSCCQGLWFVATFTFRKLLDHVQSNLFRCWFKSLMLFAGGESEINLILFPKLGIELVSGLQTERFTDQPFTHIEEDTDQCVGIISDLHGCEGKFARVCSRIYCAEETLADIGASDGAYCFQRWFICLRAKFLEILADMLGLLSNFIAQNPNKGERNAEINFAAFAQNINALVDGSGNVSFRLNKLAKDYDLLATSFLDIDCKSFRRISRLALKCSLLAYCSAFLAYFPKSSAYKKVLSCKVGNLEKLSCNVVLRDLVERLWAMDDKISMQLQLLMTTSWKETGQLQSRAQTYSLGHVGRALLLVCEFAVSGVCHLQEDSKGVEDEEDLCALFMRGLQLLSDIIKKWMVVPFRIPKYFFRVRYEMLCEFFNCMESSIRLLRLKGTMLTFANISTSIQYLSERRFTHGHLAQLKHILPEAISVRKVNLHDETTLCVKPELQVTLHVEELAAHMKLKGEGGSLILRKIFRERLVDFFKEHPQGEDIPEEELPHPFDQRKPMIPPNVARVSTFPTCVESSSKMPSNNQYVVPSHVSRSFKRRFSKKTSIPDAEKTPIACLSEASLKDGPSVSVAPSPMKHTLKPPTPYKSLPDCPTSLASSSIPGTNEEETKVPKKAGNYFPEDMNALEGTPVKFVSTPARLMTATPEIQMPKRSRPTMDYDSPPPKKTAKRSARTKLFTTPKKNTKAEVEESEGRNLSLDNYDDDDDDLTFLPKTLLQSVREKEKKALKEKESGGADSVRRQKLIAFLPRVFDTILLMFQSRKRSAMTKQEVIHKIIASHHKIVDRGEVERQLELLQELVPDWIFEKKTLTGDILYCVNELSSPEEIRQRLAEAE